MNRRSFFGALAALPLAATLEPVKPLLLDQEPGGGWRSYEDHGDGVIVVREIPEDFTPGYARGQIIIHDPRARA